jgi:hypothetical protein
MTTRRAAEQRDAIHPASFGVSSRVLQSLQLAHALECRTTVGWYAKCSRRPDAADTAHPDDDAEPGRGRVQPAERAVRQQKRGADS